MDFVVPIPLKNSRQPLDQPASPAGPAWQVMDGITHQPRRCSNVVIEEKNPLARVPAYPIHGSSSSAVLVDASFRRASDRNRSSMRG